MQSNFEGPRPQLRNFFKVHNSFSCPKYCGSADKNYGCPPLILTIRIHKTQKFHQGMINLQYCAKLAHKGADNYFHIDFGSGAKS